MRQKLRRFEANKHSENILEPGKPLFEKIKGRWNELYFKNDHPIIIEIGCGNGEYTIGLAEQNPERNYIGIDVKGDRIFVGSQYALENQLHNVAFLRISAFQLEEYFEEDEIDGIWITFPDPRPKNREEKRRLTHPRFLAMYEKMMKQGGYVQLKTDNTGFYEYTMELIRDGSANAINVSHTSNLDESELLNDHLGIQTKYEMIWKAKGSKIKYIKFQFENCN